MKAVHILILLAVTMPVCGCRKTSETISELKQNVSTTGDVEFARRTFEALARGDSAVADDIDWAALTSLGTNVGSAYVALSSELEKEKFITAFITQFATSFRESGGNLEDFTHWRVTFHNSLRTEISADAPDGVLTLVIAERDGSKRITSIQFME